MQESNTCVLHHITMEGFKEDLQRGERIMEAHNNKLEAIYDLQQAHTVAIRDLEKALGNGLRKDLNDTRVCLQTLGSKIDGTWLYLTEVWKDTHLEIESSSVRNYPEAEETPYRYASLEAWIAENIKYTLPDVMPIVIEPPTVTPEQMALKLTGGGTVEMHDTEWIRALSLPEAYWINPDFLACLELAARITDKKFPTSDDRKDRKLTLIQAGPAPGQTLPDGAHMDRGEQVDTGYYCKGGAPLNYTQYAVSGGPLPTQIWDDGWVLNSKFDHERTGYFFRVLRLICPAMTAIMDVDLKAKCGLTKDWILGDPSKGDLLHWQHAHIDFGFQRKIDLRFTTMTFCEACIYVDEM